VCIFCKNSTLSRIVQQPLVPIWRPVHRPHGEDDQLNVFGSLCNTFLFICLDFKNALPRLVFCSPDQSATRWVGLLISKRSGSFSTRLLNSLMSDWRFLYRSTSLRRLTHVMLMSVLRFSSSRPTSLMTPHR
jgi:hypothetical protein